MSNPQDHIDNIRKLAGEPTEQERIEESIEALEEAQQAHWKGEDPISGINTALAHLKNMRSNYGD